MFDYDKYLRLNKFPLIWCPGCGDGIVLKAMLRAIDRIGLEKDDITMVSGIGCSSRLTGYVDFNTLHTTHGRAIAFATGVKLANPKMNVIVVTGDGDATAIGGNHYIHAARRNLDLTVVLFNNQIYGMTGGQASPTTPVGLKARPPGATWNPPSTSAVWHRRQGRAS
jgi:2-oxoglutarate ferredoxin oxidoreductase subunit beta